MPIVCSETDIATRIALQNKAKEAMQAISGKPQKRKQKTVKKKITKLRKQLKLLCKEGYVKCTMS